MVRRNGRAGIGGGLFNVGSLSVLQSTIAADNAYGGFGGDGADNVAQPAFKGGSAGDAFGGGLYADQHAS